MQKVARLVVYLTAIVFVLALPPRPLPRGPFDPPAAAPIHVTTPDADPVGGLSPVRIALLVILAAGILVEVSRGRRAWR